MGYGAQMGGMGMGMGGSAVGHPYLDEKLIGTQRLDATNALTNQANMQSDILKHQFDAQVAMMKAEYERNCQLSEQQFKQQLDQQTMVLDQQYKQQTMQLDMARQQREMMITSQAHQMTFQAQNYQMQLDTHKKLADAYNTHVPGAPGGGAPGKG